jgi:hypothetical protein
MHWIRQAVGLAYIPLVGAVWISMLVPATISLFSPLESIHAV